jgi:hypothetical protein
MKALVLPHPPFDGIQLTARALALLWAGFWTFFCVASAISEPEGLVAGLMHQLPAVVFVAVVALAWRYELIGGILLIAIAAVAFVFFRVYAQALVTGLVLLGPPCLSGVLFVTHSRMAQR